MKPRAASPELPAAHQNFRSNPHQPSYNTTGTTAVTSAPLPVKGCPYTECIQSPRPVHRKKTGTAAGTTAPSPPELPAIATGTSGLLRRLLHRHTSRLQPSSSSPTGTSGRSPELPAACVPAS